MQLWYNVATSLIDYITTPNSLIESMGAAAHDLGGTPKVAQCLFSQRSDLYVWPVVLGKRVLCNSSQSEIHQSGHLQRAVQAQV